MRTIVCKLLAVAALASGVSAFAPRPSSQIRSRTTAAVTQHHDTTVSSESQARAASTAPHVQQQERQRQQLPGLLPIALGVAASTIATPAFADVPGWVGPTRAALDPFLLYMEFAFLCRIVLSWYPQTDLNKAPQNLVAWPTEPILKPTRAVVPPAFGVDISPIVWVMILSFVREILFGQQGIFNMLSQQS
ncbi:YGGT family-domain-containing protein [Tribonema minus]|uniref:YGGT family-domain-containing protein n=1 Tax=Tribonema minus TaxID=303371 RepID=A0A836CA21_9STRA|nr:YGGT family-domain-containing protein [Tribonema minus]